MQLVQYLIDKQGVELVRDQLDLLLVKNLSTYNRDAVKRLFGSIIGLIEIAVPYESFIQRGLNAGLLDQLLSFLISPILFDDEDFTQDLFGYVLTSCLLFFKGNSTLPSRATLQNRFGLSLLPIRHQIDTEESAILKLHLAVLLAQRDLTKLSQAELNEQFYMDPTIIATLRIYILTFATTRLNGQPNTNHEIFFKTSYWPFKNLDFAPYDLVKQFNTLLLSEPNRNQACDRQSFDAYIFAFFNLHELSLQLAVYASRGLFIATQTCSEYQQFLSKTNMKHRKSIKIG